MQAFSRKEWGGWLIFRVNADSHPEGFHFWASRTHEGPETGRLGGACEGSPGWGWGVLWTGRRSEAVFLPARCHPPSPCPRVSQPPGVESSAAMQKCPPHVARLQPADALFAAHASELALRDPPPPLKGVVFPAITKVCFCFEPPVFAC